MRRILSFGLAVIMLLGACTAEEGMEVREAWARSAQEGDNGAVYLVIQNNARQADELVGISSDIAESIEVHESAMSGDVMQMHPLHSVALAPGAEVQFEPGGLHIMLVDLKRDLTSGEQFEITLQFKNHEDINVTVSIGSPENSSEPGY